MAAAAEMAFPVLVDWTSASASKCLSSMSQLCQHSMRHFRRAAFRGGRGKLVAAKQVNNGQTGSKGAMQQWRLVTEEMDLGGRFNFGRMLSTSAHSFAATPLLVGQGLVIKVTQDLSGILTEGLLRPLLLMALYSPPSFAAAPLMSSPAAVSAAGAVRMAVAAVADLAPAQLAPPAPGVVTKLEPVARFAALGAGPLHAPCSPTSHQSQPNQLRTTLMAWKHVFAPQQRRTYKKWTHSADWKRADQGSSSRGALHKFAALGR